MVSGVCELRSPVLLIMGAFLARPQPGRVLLTREGIRRQHEHFHTKIVIAGHHTHTQSKEVRDDEEDR